MAREEGEPSAAARERQRPRLAGEEREGPPGDHLAEPISAPRERSRPDPLIDGFRLHGRRHASHARCNAEMGATAVREHGRLDAQGEALLRQAMRQLSLTARSYHRVLKLSRTIADLAGAEDIRTADVAEALQYRPRGVG